VRHLPLPVALGPRADHFLARNGDAGPRCFLDTKRHDNTLRTASLSFKVRRNRFKPWLTAGWLIVSAPPARTAHRSRRMVSNARSARNIHLVNGKMKAIHLNDIKSPLTSVSRLFEPNAYGGSHYEHALALWYPASRSDLLHRIRPDDNAGRPSRPPGKGRLVHFKRLIRRKDMRLHEPSAMPSYKGRTRRLLLSRFIRGRHVGCARLRPERRAASEQLKMFGMMVARRRLRDHRPSRAIIAPVSLLCRGGASACMMGRKRPTFVRGFRPSTLQH
jgi:hypothetical protein